MRYLFEVELYLICRLHTRFRVPLFYNTRIKKQDYGEEVTILPNTMCDVLVCVCLLCFCIVICVANLVVFLRFKYFKKTKQVSRCLRFKYFKKMYNLKPLINRSVVQ